LKRIDIDTFEKLKAQLDSLHSEMGVLAKKSPNDAVNSFKIRLVNSTLEKCNLFFGRKYAPFDDFNVFSEDDLPSNSDVTFIVSQYIECAEKLRSDNIYSDYEGWFWKLDDGGERIQTAAPKKIGK
jgi:hypothetical protein